MHPPCGVSLLLLGVAAPGPSSCPGPNLMDLIPCSLPLIFTGVRGRGALRSSLGPSARRSGAAFFGLSRRRNNTKLLHQAQVVFVAPMLHHLARHKAKYVHTRHRHLFASGRGTHEVAPV